MVAQRRDRDEAQAIADLFIPQITGCTRERLAEMLPKLTLGTRAQPALVVVRDPKAWTIPLDRDLFDEAVCVTDSVENVLRVFDRDGHVVLRPPFDLELYPEGLTCSLQDPAAIAATFQRYGVVVVRDVLDARECEATVDEIWKTLIEQSDGTLRRDDASTWDEAWPRQGTQFGIVGMGLLRFLEPQACRNRVKTYDAFRAVLGEEELITNVTRSGCMRPTRDVWMGEGVGTVQRPEWASLSDWVHIDLNPFTGQVSSFGFTSTGTQHTTRGFDNPFVARAAFLKRIGPGCPPPAVQAILAAADCPVSVGGFHAVPSFHHLAHSWAVLHAHTCLTANTSMDPATVQLPESDPLRAHVQQFPLEAGSLLIWNSLLPHGNFPNTGPGPGEGGMHTVAERCRYVQYTHMTTAHDPYLLPYPLSPEDLPLRDTEHTPLLRRLYGFESWPSPAARSRYEVYQAARRSVAAVVPGMGPAGSAADSIAVTDNPTTRDMYFNMTRVAQQRTFVAMLAEEQATGHRPVRAIRAKSGAAATTGSVSGHEDSSRGDKAAAATTSMSMVEHPAEPGPLSHISGATQCATPTPAAAAAAPGSSAVAAPTEPLSSPDSAVTLKRACPASMISPRKFEVLV